MSSIWTGILHIKVLDEQLPREAVTTLEVTSKHMYNQLYQRLQCNWGLEKKESVFWQGSLTGSQMQAPLFLLRMTSWDPHRPYTWKELQGSLCFQKVSVHIQILQFSSVQLLSCVIFSATPWTLACQASLSINNLQSPPKPMSIESVMPSNHLILCHLLLLPPQSLPASGSFPLSQFFASSGQSIGVSASTSVLPINTQDWSPLGWTGWISSQSKGLSRVFSNTTVQ